MLVLEIRLSHKKMTMTYFSKFFTINNKKFVLIGSVRLRPCLDLDHHTDGHHTSNYAKVELLRLISNQETLLNMT